MSQIEVREGRFIFRIGGVAGSVEDAERLLLEYMRELCENVGGVLQVREESISEKVITCKILPTENVQLAGLSANIRNRDGEGEIHLMFDLVTKTGTVTKLGTIARLDLNIPVSENGMVRLVVEREPARLVLAERDGLCQVWYSERPRVLEISMRIRKTRLDKLQSLLVSLKTVK